MWLRSRAEPLELLRIGAHAVERWAGPSGRLELVGRHLLPEPRVSIEEGLEVTLQNLFPTAPASAVTILLESIHLPVVHLEVGTTLWSRAQVEPLLIHRLNAQYADRQREAPKWSCRLDYRPGDACGLGYGLPEQAQKALLMATDAVGIRCDALLPAFAWGLARFRRAHHVPNLTGWWFWTEQDRLLAARIEHKRIASLNGGVPAPATPEQIARVVDAECFRSGRGSPNDAIEVATWSTEHPQDSSQEVVLWTSIAAPTAHVDRPAQWRIPGLRSAAA